MTDTANTIANKLSGEAAPETTTEVETPEQLDTESTVTVEVETDEDAEEAPEDSKEVSEDDLPDPIKEILKKNRKLVRDAENRAKAAEKALAAKEGTTEEVSDSKFRDLYVTRSAKAALTEAGLTSGTERFLKMIDLAEVDVDEDGELSGLDTQIEALKADYPELFGKKEVTPKKTTVKADAAGRRNTTTAPSTSASKISDRLLGK